MSWKFNPFTNKLDNTLSDAAVIALVSASYLKLNCSNDPLTADLEISHATASFLVVTSTDHTIAGIRLCRSTWETDIYTDYSIYNNSAGDLYIDKLLSSVTTNILHYDEDINRWNLLGNLKIGSALITVDPVLTFDGFANNGLVTWMDDEKYFLFNNDMSVTGKIGIGTVTPDTALHVTVDNATSVIRLERNDASISADDVIGRLEVETQDPTDPGICAKLEAISYGSSGETGWRFSGGTPSVLTELMRIDYLGNVGIGVVEPDALLHLESITGAVQRLTRKDTSVNSDDIIGRIEFEIQDTGNAGIAAYFQAIAEGTDGEVGLVFGTGDRLTVTERLRIDHDGNLLPDTDSDYSLGSTSLRWLKLWVDEITVGAIGTGHLTVDVTMLLQSGSITDSTGAITFDNENLLTSGTLGAGATTLTGDLLISKVDPEIRLTDTGNSEYTRIIRSDTANVATQYNRVKKPGTLTDCAVFDGATGIDCGDNAVCHFTSTMSISVWYKTSSSAKQRLVSRLAEFMDWSGYQLVLGEVTHKASFYVGSGVHSTTSVDDGYWHHIVGTADGATLRIYIDSVEEGTPAAQGTLNFDPTYGRNLLIGRASFMASDYPTGSMDELIFYNIALSQAQVTALYNGGSPVQQSAGTGLSIGYHFNDDLTDFSGNGVNGSVSPGTITYTTGKVTLSDSMVESKVWESKDGAASLEEGIQTFGDADGGTVINGKTVTIQALTGVLRADSGLVSVDTTVEDTQLVSSTKTDDYDVLTTDTGKLLIMNSSSDKAFNLPSVTAANVGIWFIFAKINTGRVTIDANDSDLIADSGAGDTIYNDQADEVYATIKLVLVSETQWSICGANGTWITTT